MRIEQIITATLSWNQQPPTVAEPEGRLLALSRTKTNTNIDTIVNVPGKEPALSSRATQD